MSSYVHFNIPNIGEVPPTPITPFIDDDLTPIATDVLLSAAASFGMAISYIQEQNGKLIQNIVPTHKTEYGQISTSSKNDLYLHTEAAFHPYKPSHVMLLCLRGDDSAGTTIASVNEIMKYLDDETISILQMPIFSTGIDESFMNGKNNDFRLITEVLRRNEHEVEHMQWTMTFDWQLMCGENEEANEALEKFKDAVSKSIETIYLKSGDLIIIDNRRAVHGRTKFQPRYDGTDRWLKRVLSIKHMPPVQHIKGNLIVTEFANG
jgi:L-asparagine oxygenase